MNKKRYFFWIGFFVLLGLIIWGLILASNKSTNSTILDLSEPAPISLEDHVYGQDNAPVTLIEYSDFQCPACGVYYYLVKQLIASTTVPIKVVYRHFPLSQHLNAMPAALASEAAGVQGKFWEMYSLLFENSSEWTDQDDPSSIFISYAERLNLDISRFKTDMASSTLKSHIESNLEEGLSIGIDSTPTFFINGKAIVNPSSYDKFKTIIQKSASENNTK